MHYPTEKLSSSSYAAYFRLLFYIPLQHIGCHDPNMRSSFSMPLLYHAYVYLEFLILACTIYILAPNLSDYGFIGELSLDGRLRACRGILPMIIAAKKRKIKKLIVPFENINEAKLVHGIETIGLHDLREVIQYVEGKNIEGLAFQ